MYHTLLLDDHPAIRLAIRSILEQSGKFVITESETGKHGLELVKNVSYDLAIIDLDLPDISGLEVIERLTRNYPQTKILVLSALNEAIYAPLCMQSGADGFISKSSNLNSILHAAESIMNGYSIFSRKLSQIHFQQFNNQEKQQVHRLSPRELHILKLLTSGLSNKEIGEKLFISNKTVSTYKTNILNKLGLSTLVELVDFARSHKLI